MNRTAILLFFSSIVLAGLFPACTDWEDDYSTNPAHQLTFSVDTLAFDTVFTAVGSATRQFMVYNANKEALLIESIGLAGERTGFRINVDGRAGESFSGIRIGGKDSMYVFVEVTVDPTGKDQPLLVEDHVAFTVNGVTKSVLLQAYGQDVHLFKGGVVMTKDTLLTGKRPFLVYDSVVVNAGVTVTIEKGASFHMHNEARWIVAGTIKAFGTREEPVTFRGDRLDKLLEELPYDLVPGQWGRMIFKAESYDNEMEYVAVRNGIGGLVFEASTPERSKLKITNSQITNMDDNLLSAVNCRIEAVNTELTNATGSVVALTGGSYRFIHCTVANYMRIKRRKAACLTLANVVEETGDGGVVKTGFPLDAVFDNCIIDGSYSAGTDSLGGELDIRLEGDAAARYLFNHCVVKTKKIDNPSFVNVQFEKSPAYKLLSWDGEEQTFVYDFRPDISKDEQGVAEKEQVVIGKADPFIAGQYPLDRYGVNRLTGEDGPDIGAAEYVPEPEKEER
ncbi:MAG: hypothetical protein LBQ39_03940 [Tannerellaceae bacterium]|jgi:hypothetical protein|nr:hypothetical protein [Tannerellaceae bacterium]